MARKRRSRRKNSLPKGAYRLPTGGYMLSSSYQSPRGRRLRIHSIVRDEPDARLIAGAILELAAKLMAEARQDQAEDDPRAA